MYIRVIYNSTRYLQTTTYGFSPNMYVVFDYRIEKQYFYVFQ